MSSQYIFTMHRLSKLHPPDKTVLDNLTLAFFPGAKIGVLGYNGAGKSSLLRIMAGVDQEYRGEAALAPGATVGMLEQEPALDESKDVKGNVEDGVAETRALLDRFEELAANYSEDTAEEFGEIQAKIDAADAWNLDTQLQIAMDAQIFAPEFLDACLKVLGLWVASRLETLMPRSESHSSWGCRIIHEKISGGSP